MTTQPSLEMNVSPNIPDCTIQVTHSTPGVIQLSHGKVGTDEVVDDGTQEDLVPDETTGLYSDFVWVITGLSAPIPLKYYATCSMNGLSNTVEWTQPALDGDTTPDSLVEFGDNVKAHLGAISEICSTISSRGFSMPNEWSELVRLMNQVQLRGTLVLDG